MPKRQFLILNALFGSLGHKNKVFAKILFFEYFVQFFRIVTCSAVVRPLEIRTLIILPSTKNPIQNITCRFVNNVHLNSGADKSYSQAHVILFTILVCQAYSIQYPYFLLQIAVKFLCGGIVKFVQIRSKASWNKIISTLRQIFLPKNKTSKTESRRNKNQPTLKIFYVKLNLHFVELSYLFIQSNLIILLISHQLKLF